MRVNDPDKATPNQMQEGMPKGMAHAPDMADNNVELNILRQKWRAWKRINPMRMWRLQNQLSVEAAAAALQIPYGTYLTWESGAKMPHEVINIVNTQGKREARVRWDEHMFPLTNISYLDMDNWSRRNPMHKAARLFKKLVK